MNGAQQNGKLTLLWRFLPTAIAISSGFLSAYVTQQAHGIRISQLERVFDRHEALRGHSGIIERIESIDIRLNRLESGLTTPMAAETREKFKSVDLRTDRIEERLSHLERRGGSR